MSSYSAGVCNINQAESKKRYVSGGMGLFLAYVTGSLFVFYYDSVAYLLAFFVFATFGFLGVLQGRKNFCVAHGLQGTEKTSAEPSDVKDIEKRLKDRKAAAVTGLKALILGTIASLLVYFLSLTV